MKKICLACTALLLMLLLSTASASAPHQSRFITILPDLGRSVSALYEDAAGRAFCTGVLAADHLTMTTGTVFTLQDTPSFVARPDDSTLIVAFVMDGVGHMITYTGGKDVASCSEMPCQSPDALVMAFRLAGMSYHQNDRSELISALNSMGFDYVKGVDF